VRRLRLRLLYLFFVLFLAACGGGGGGAPSSASTPAPAPDPDPIYQVALIADDAMPADACMAPLFAPADLADPIFATTVNLAQHQNETGFIGDDAPMLAYPRHLTDGGPTMTLDTAVQMTDDIRILIGTNAAGQFVSVEIKGQPLIGLEPLSHESEIVQLSQSVDPLDTQEFVVHVDTLQPVPMWQLEDHLGGGERVEVVGHFCLGDMVFTPIP